MAPHPDKSVRKTKIVCTIGPSCWEPDMLLRMMDAGMNVCRLNFSHGDHAGHGEVADRIREACAKRALEGKSEHVAVMLDTKGPEIRTGTFADGAKTISLKAGQDFELHSADYSFKGNNQKLACSYAVRKQERGKMKKRESVCGGRG
jgi:pyruvate kinase